MSEGLEATGLVGRPAEYFAPDFYGLWRGWWQLAGDCPLGTYIATALAYATTPNGVRGAKIHWSHVLLLAQSVGVVGDPASVLEALFPGSVFVNIVRRDRRAQALSLFRALYTEEWCRFDGSTPPSRDASTLRPELAEIRQLESSIEWEQDCWVDYFQQHSVPVHTVEYEQLDADYAGQIRQVLQFLGADPAAADRLPSPRLQRQSDELTHCWREQLDAGRPEASDGSP